MAKQICKYRYVQIDIEERICKTRYDGVDMKKILPHVFNKEQDSVPLLTI